MTTSHRGATGRVVVGIDGSRPSLAALRWAAGECRRGGFGLHLVTCWSDPIPVVSWTPYQPPLSSEEFELAAHDAVEHAIAEILDPDFADVDVTVEVISGTPSLHLLEFQDVAEMIVVGSRGRGGFTGLLLGSVSQHLAAHCHCPVVIIHGDQEDQETDR